MSLIPGVVLELLIEEAETFRMRRRTPSRFRHPAPVRAGLGLRDLVWN